MEIEYGPFKGVDNLRKHGVPLVLGAGVIISAVVTLADKRRQYGEERFNAQGLVDGKHYTCTYTMRQSVYRIISFRRASKKERRLWFT
jgi:uncharacterized DUF497 family protein